MYSYLYVQNEILRIKDPPQIRPYNWLRQKLSAPFVKTKLNVLNILHAKYETDSKISKKMIV